MKTRFNRELKQWRRRPREKHLVKMNLHFAFEFRNCLVLFSARVGLRTCSGEICNTSIRVLQKYAEFSHVVVVVV